MVSLWSWYRQRSLREQRLILLMSVIAVPVLAWLLVIAPLQRSYDRALEEHLTAVDRNGTVRALARRIEMAPDAQGPQSPLGPDLPLVVAESGAQAGLTLDSNEASGADQVSVSIPQASPVIALQWLQDLELRGFAIEELRMVPGQAGTVSVTARLVRRSR